MSPGLDKSMVWYESCASAVEMKPPLLTVIVAVFNGAATLQQCIDSVTHQSFPYKELIIIDGVSQDGTIDLLKENSEQISYWISEPDNGVYNAWNKGLAQAKGEWICFLGADDYFWDTQVLERMQRALQSVPSDVRLAYGQVMLVGTDGKSLYPTGEPWGNFKVRFMQGLCLPHQGVMHRRSLFVQKGKFDESFRIAADYELMLRELKTGEAIFIPDIIVTAMRQGGLSSNPSNTIVTMREIRRAQKMHGLYFPSFFWHRAMFRVYLRLLLWHTIGESTTRKFLDFGRHLKRLPPYWTKTNRSN